MLDETVMRQVVGYTGGHSYETDTSQCRTHCASRCLFLSAVCCYPPKPAFTAGFPRPAAAGAAPVVSHHGRATVATVAAVESVSL